MAVPSASSRDDRESVNAFGETFRYNLDRNLESTDFQMGLDLGRRGLLSPTTSWCSGCSAASSTALSITTISRGPSTSRAGRSAATPPILGWRAVRRHPCQRASVRRRHPLDHGLPRLAQCCHGGGEDRFRLPLRLVQKRTSTTMEPFVIGSLWGNLSDDNELHPQGRPARRMGRGLCRGELLQPLGQHEPVRQGRRHLRRGPRRRRRQGRNARRLVDRNP